MSARGLVVEFAVDQLRFSQSPATSFPSAARTHTYYTPDAGKPRCRPPLRQFYAGATASASLTRRSQAMPSTRARSERTSASSSPAANFRRLRSMEHAAGQQAASRLIDSRWRAKSPSAREDAGPVDRIPSRRPEADPRAPDVLATGFIDTLDASADGSAVSPSSARARQPLQPRSPAQPPERDRGRDTSFTSTGEPLADRPLVSADRVGEPSLRPASSSRRRSPRRSRACSSAPSTSRASNFSHPDFLTPRGDLFVRIWDQGAPRGPPSTPAAHGISTTARISARAPHRGPRQRPG